MAIRGHVLPYTARDGRTWWRIRFDYGRDPNTGKRPQPYHHERYPDERAAQRDMVLLLQRANNGHRPDPKRRCVAELLVEWLDVEARNGVRPKTLKSYESCCRVHVVPHLGATRLDKLTTGMVEHFRAQRLAAGVSTRMVELATLHLHQALAYAVRHGYLTHNPAGDLTPLKHEHREMQVWSQDEARRFLAVADRQAYHPIWQLALRTGMRKGELLALTWQDVALDRAQVRVRRGLSMGESGDTKTGRARTIDLDPAMVRMLREHRARQGETRLHLGSDSDLVLATAHGTPINEFNVTRAMDMLIVRAGVKRIRFHDLRHTCATHLLLAGRPVHLVSRMLGHADAATTLKYYAHLLEGQGEETARIIGQIFGG